ncbi:MAG: HD domain-containing protein [Candidatus Marinimicrobia bacterium]|jgi:putative nucleotidyltransferase with HDIG domain|nr:HD domain-containing protein [Candidatus Neomarinimicrobiota bacterium]MBT3575573.1 HD domain-containing protein [Candidatus Neomarinimicrobiota bacterium]MBT3679670.1 HD domain-containing protein [Candidatus Neomarinimicrobiota bacterium]MBT3950627.1 HD domain-containing protein [Candidatus Neomarinimicrobiota bacterium]MBT4253386.1 HD domain-containing protein [Candidatus Neomarinimicrobiota bacterium]
MISRIPKNILSVLERAGRLAETINIECYTVGGFVRDLILDVPSKDVDIMVIGDGLDFARKLGKELGVPDIVEYGEFGTALIPYGEFLIEVASARSETYESDSRKPKVIYTDLKGDLSRRDFTVNAMAINLLPEHFGELVDEYGGIQDIQDKILRTPLDPVKTFDDDPLRMMRAARFSAQLEFELVPEAMQAMQASVDRISIVSQERVTDEIVKTLKARVPSIGFYVMQKAGLLPLVFPEIAILGGVEDRDGQRHKDVFHHTLKVVDNTAERSDKMRLRFAALVHDIGKPATKKFIEGIGWSYHGHEELGRKMLNEVGKRMRLSRKLTAYLKRMTRLHLRPIALAQEAVSDSGIRRLIVEAGENLDDLMILVRADVTSKDSRRVKRYYGNFDRVMNRIVEVVEKDAMRAFQSPLRGDEIIELLGVPPGPVIGEIKKAIEEAILDGEIPNEYDAAREYFFKIKDTFLD